MSSYLIVSCLILSYHCSSHLIFLYLIQTYFILNFDLIVILTSDAIKTFLPLSKASLTPNLFYHFNFTDNRMWQYKKEGLVQGMPKSLSHMQFPEKPSYAVALSDIEGNRRVYLFGVSQSHYQTLYKIMKKKRLPFIKCSSVGTRHI